MQFYKELFPVVDENDRVIGRLPRHVVHRRKLLHRSVHGLVISSSNKIYLQHRSPRRVCNPGLWDSSVSGHVEAGETYDQAIVREAVEELKLHLRITPKRLFKLRACAETELEHVWAYVIRDNGPFQIDRSEAVEAKWFSVETLNRWIRHRPELLTPSLILIWQQFLERN